MLLLRTERLPEGPDWNFELKLDGYRAIAAKSGGMVHLWSRNENDFGARYPARLLPLTRAHGLGNRLLAVCRRLRGSVGTRLCWCLG